MHDAHSLDGIYLVAWPDLGSWTDTTDNRRAALAARNRGQVTEKLANQASDLFKGLGLRVRVVHLDIDYRRPHE